MAAGLTLALLTEENFSQAAVIDRSDVPLSYVDSAEELMALTRYGLERGCLGHSFVILLDGTCIGVLLLGEAIPWETDPPEMQGVPFYRLMCFVLDRRYRGLGLGGRALEMAINRVYRDFGVRPIALGCHRENLRAAAFYRCHGFQSTPCMEGDDIYYLRYPESAGTHQA